MIDHCQYYKQYLFYINLFSALFMSIKAPTNEEENGVN